MELEAPKAVWVSAKHFNAENVLAGTIQAVRAEKGKYGLDYIVTIKSQEHGELDMTVWGGNFNFLYNKYGSKSTDWVGKPISIVQHIENGKPRRVVC